MLNIFHTGGLTLALTLLFALGEFFFIKQAVNHSKVEGNPIYKSPFSWLAVFLLAAYVFALIQVASDYKGV